MGYVLIIGVLCLFWLLSWLGGKYLLNSFINEDGEEVGKVKFEENTLYLEELNIVKVVVPASVCRTCVYLSVSSDGKLIIQGGSSVIDSIIGVGMKEKVK